jgi:pimeloyl-ACP methyl ester carboxylesterase
MLGHDVFVIDEPPLGAETADPALVLHGFPTSSFEWRQSLATLGADRRVVLVDLLGYGLSAKPDIAYHLTDQADIVEAVVADLGLERVVLVTHDMGDSVGGELLARAIDGTLQFEVSRRVLTNGSIYLDLAQLTDGQQLLRALPDEALPETTGIDRAALTVALRATFAPDSDVPTAELVAMTEAIMRDGGNRLLPRLIRYIDERAVHERRWTGAIESHPAPLTVIWGDLDPIAVWPMVERLHSARADATVHRLDGVGHYPMLESPARFNAALAAALV